MRLRFTERADKDYAELAGPIRKALLKQLGYLLKNLNHPSLHAKKYDTANDVWQGRVNRSLAILFRNCWGRIRDSFDHSPPEIAEETSMETLARVAERILETARVTPGDWTVLITRAGQTQMLAANDWPLESLLAERSGAMAFRVAHRDGGITVDGRSLGDRCRLEALKTPVTGGRRAEMQRLLPGPWG